MKRALAGVAVVLGIVLACTPAPVVVPSPSPSPSATPQPTASPSASPSPSPTRRTQRPQPPSPCDGKDPFQGIADPGKYTLVAGCQQVQGTLVAAAPAADGVAQLRLSPDYGQAGVFALANMTRLGEQLPVNVVCVDPLSEAAAALCGTFRAKVGVPAIGTHVRITGALMSDSAGGWNVLQPAWEIASLAEPPPSVPASVVETQRVWSQIRSRWPAIPPAIVLAEQQTGAVASATLYPDGIARVFVGQSTPEPHVVWHEAGHVLQAVALKQRGHLEALYTATDDIGIAFWAARGFPGTWAQNLRSNWSSLAYEALAESFAAVNLGDDERTVTYNVPLDRAAMRAFFEGIATAP